MYNKKDYERMIRLSLIENNLWGGAEAELNQKCGKPHITSLPYDLRTNDPIKLQERIDKVDKELEKITRELGDLEKNINQLENEKKNWEDQIKQEEEYVRQSDEIIKKFKQARDDEAKLLKNDVEDIQHNWEDVVSKLHTEDVLDDYADTNLASIYSSVIEGLSDLRSPFNYNKLDGVDFASTLAGFGYNIMGRDENLGNQIIEIADNYKELHEKYPSSELLEFRERYKSARNLKKSANNSLKEYKEYLSQTEDELKGAYKEYSSKERIKNDFEVEKKRSKYKLDKI